MNCNAKAGMDAVEFSKYLQTSVMSLYPDVQDTPGKRVIIIVDSGPGRLDLGMLATLRALWFLSNGRSSKHHSCYPSNRPELWTV